jgi:hypothetical protein
MIASAALMPAEGRKRRLLVATALYLVVVAVYFAATPRFRILAHTSYNHFTQLADCWLDGRLDLGHPPPHYAANNDFANYRGKWFITFPPFPAILLLPLVWFAKSPENVRDGQFFLWLAGVGPAVLFLALEKLRRMGHSERKEWENAALALLFAFGSVYFFSAIQGSVWFAAHVVGVGIGALYLLFALDAERPVLAGLMIGLGFLTRTPLLFATPLFLLEATRVALAPGEGSFLSRLDKKKLMKALALFGLPLAACFGAAMAHNAARFGSPFEFGYEFLTVAWQGRMKRWGLFHYHFLARNMGVAFTSLPYWEPGNDRALPFMVNYHGLALWFTTPLYLYLVWPKRVGKVAFALYVAALAVAIPGLMYQNTGWQQFGYRFSNDYAVFLFALIAVIGHRFGKLFTALAVWSVAVNTFGALTFDRNREYYFDDPSQKILYQPD